MAQSEASQSKDEDSLKDVFDIAMKMYKSLEDSNEDTGSEMKQRTIKTAISKFEEATNLVSLSGMFSKNESLEELPTEHLQYLLLPALLGTLVLKICGQSRKEHITVAEVYFKDFLQRCKDYGVTDVEIPQPDQAVDKPLNEKAKITQMVQSREAKIKRYKEMKELEKKLSTLSKAMAESNVDDETKREYFITMLNSYVNQALDELNSIEQEKPILEYMAKHGAEKRPREPVRPLKPVIITRDALQKAVFGAGYPSLPSMTVEEFYDKRVRDGVFPPSASNIPHATIENPDADADEDEQVRKERLVEEEDPEELERQRNMDEYKDDHRRGWGNRYNRS
ncbi:immunoglobulin-binding protein 1 family member C [Epargyreus clarus]|uniref:immunoglobulin-binding protein 1 family member C n=1 Tax=Epargyreus clarus TaxID=520877 RepID=UPI003C2B725B